MGQGGRNRVAALGGGVPACSRISEIERGRSLCSGPSLEPDRILVLFPQGGCIVQTLMHLRPFRPSRVLRTGIVPSIAVSHGNGPTRRLLPRLS